jgi:hypothetical protein
VPLHRSMHVQLRTQELSASDRPQATASAKSVRRPLSARGGQREPAAAPTRKMFITAGERAVGARKLPLWTRSGPRRCAPSRLCTERLWRLVAADPRLIDEPRQWWRGCDRRELMLIKRGPPRCQPRRRLISKATIDAATATFSDSTWLRMGIRSCVSVGIVDPWVSPPSTSTARGARSV